MSRIWAILAGAVLFVSGCGGQEGPAKHAGQAVGETLTNFAHGVGSGIDKGFKVDVELSEGLTSLGLSRTVAKTVSMDGHRAGLTVYIKSQHPATVALIAKAMDAENEEIGRATVDAKFAADDAQYVTFPFQAEMDAELVRRYVIDVRPTPAKPDHMPTSTNPEAEPQK